MMQRMIGQLKGVITHKSSSWIILDTGSVGYKLYLGEDLHIKAREQEPLTVWTHLAVRENALDLYGFETMEELSFFELLLSVSGIGPKSALGILDVASPSTLRKAISTGETAPLTKVSGIGKKNAEKIVLELRGKLGVSGEGENDGVNERDIEVFEALTALGYSAHDAREAVKKLPADIPDTQGRVKEALRQIADS